MKKFPLRVLVLFLSIFLIPWPYQLGYQAMPAQAAEVPSEDAAIADLSREKTELTTGDDVSTEQKNVSSDSPSQDSERSTNSGVENNDLSMTSDTQESSDISSRDTESSNDIQKSKSSLEGQETQKYNSSFISPADLGNEQWLMDEVTRQAQVSYPGSSVSKNDIPRSFLENVRTLASSNESSIRGTIPPEIVNLVNLEHLRIISQPNLSGTIPENIGRLKNLKTLDLQLSSISGSIPDSIGQLSNITTIILHNLPLTGQIPSSIGNLSSLSNLTITNTNVTGSIPESIGNLVSLTRLNLNSNQNLTGELPSNIGNLVNLTDLILFGNPGLNGQIPKSIGNLVNLRSLYLSNCNFSGRVPEELGNLRNATIATLARNRLTGIVPPAVLKTMPFVDLRNTGVTTNNNLSMDASFWGNTFGNTTTAWKLASTQNKIKGTGIISPFDSTKDSFFDLKRTQRSTSQTLFETHQYTIYAGNPDTGDIVYNGLADTSASFEARLGIDYYTVVLDEAQNNSNNVTRVNVDVPNLFAEVVPQKVTLGSSLEGIDPKSLVRNVKLNGKVLSTDEYTVTVETKPNTSTVGTEKNVKVRIDHNQDYIELTVPVEVQWGNTILTRGLGNWVTGAYTYHPETKQVTSRLGLSEGDGPIHSHFDRYYSLDFYHLSKDQEILNKENLYYSYVVNGTDSRYQVIEKFGNNGALNVSVGDVLKVYHAEPGNRLVQFQDEIESPIPTNTNKEVYLELTDTGYKLLTFDRAVPVERTIKVGMTPKELEKTVTQSLDLSATKDVSVLGFTKYPDTSVKGTSSGTIRVEETLSTGKKVQYDYDVSFVVEAGDLKISEFTNSDFDFGEAKRSSQRQEIQAAGASAPTITISDYSDTTKWSLYVSASPFINKENQELSGAQLTLKDFSLVNTVHQSLMVNSRAIILSSSAQIVAAMTNPDYINGIENGETTLQIGSVKDEALTGVSLSLPANTPMDAGDYQATITWELVGDPTL